MLTPMAVPAGYRKMVLCKVRLVARSAPEYCQLQSRIRKWKCAIESASSGSMTTYAAPSAKGSPSAVASHLRFGISDLITLDHFEWPDSAF